MAEATLLTILLKFEEEEHDNFKWFLEKGSVKGYKSIPKSQLKNAKRRDTVDVMVQTFQLYGAVEATKKILELMNRNDLLHSEEMKKLIAAVKPKGIEEDKEELKRVQQYEVDVTLDPDTAHPALVLSDDGKQVYDADCRKDLPDNPERFDPCGCVLGKQSFSKGRFYFEVQVKEKTDWYLGVARESVNRKGYITLSPQDGIWTIWLRNGNEYKAFADPSVKLSLKFQPQKVGVFVDYEEGLVSFYDVDAAIQIFSFSGYRFKEKLYPFLSPCPNYGGRNLVPLIICPVNQTA